MSSTCRRSPRSSRAFAAARCAWRSSRCPSRRRSPPRCCSATSPTTSTTATRRWPSAGPTRCRWTRPSFAISSATPSCATCSMRGRSRRSKPISSICPSDFTPARPMRCTTCCCGLATCREPSWRHGRRPGLLPTAVPELLQSRRAIEIRIAGDDRLVAVEDAARFRDALGVSMPPGLPAVLLEPVAEPLNDLDSALRPDPRSLSQRRGRPALRPERRRGRVGTCASASTGRVIDGEFRPGERGREWCDEDVLRQIRRRSLARLRQEVEPVDAASLGRFLVSWHGLSRVRGGLDSLLDVVEQLQGVPLAGSVLEREILPARIADYSPAMLDTLLGAGEIVWVGVEPIGDRDGRITLYLTDHLSQAAHARGASRPIGGAARTRGADRRHG